MRNWGVGGTCHGRNTSKSLNMTSGKLDEL